MRFIPLLILLVLVSGCVCPLFKGGATTTTTKPTTLATRGTAATTTTSVQKATTVASTIATTTTLGMVAYLPTYSADDSWSFTVLKSEGMWDTYESSIDVKYVGKTDDGSQDVLDRQYSGLKTQSGESAANVLASSRDYYSTLDGNWILDKVVAYPRASTGGYTSYSYSPGKVELSFPLEIGKTWNGSSEMSARHLNRLTYKLTVKYFNSVTGVKEITTPVGVFQCMEIENTEEEYLGDKLIKTTKKVTYYCPSLKYYAYWTTDVILTSGKKTDKVRVPQYQTVLDLYEEHGKTTLKEYKAA
jgi:hypothetical protein